MKSLTKKTPWVNDWATHRGVILSGELVEFNCDPTKFTTYLREMVVDDEYYFKGSFSKSLQTREVSESALDKIGKERWEEHYSNEIPSYFSKEKSTRHSEGKPDWTKLFRLWPKALPELLRVIEYGYAKHGEQNCRKSINTDKHDSFREGCVKSGSRHWLEDCQGNKIDEGQDGIYHAAFEAWNALTKLEYDLSKEQK